jgi:hypothetical protein
MIVEDILIMIQKNRINNKKQLISVLKCLGDSIRGQKRLRMTTHQVAAMHKLCGGRNPGFGKAGVAQWLAAATWKPSSCWQQLVDTDGK